MCRISIVIPLYNKCRTIARALNSVLAQSHTEFELIVIDDGSSDGSGDIVAGCKDSRVQIHYQQNAGPGLARNRGTALSRETLITYLDADDEWHPDFLGVAIDRLLRNPNCDAFACETLVGDSAQPRWNRLRHLGFYEGPWRISPNIRLDALAHCLAAFSSSSVVYRKPVVEKYGGFFSEERCTLGEDVFLWIQILLNHTIYRHMSPLAFYHTEDSELGIGCKRASYPLEPVFTHTFRVRQHCPSELRETFELWLGKHAIRTAFLQISTGHLDHARSLITSFPSMRRWGADYTRLRMKMLCPRLWAAAKGLRRIAALPFTTHHANYGTKYS